MKILKKSLKIIALRNLVDLKNAINASIQPFKEVPSIHSIEPEDQGRLTAHDLFSLYTADIIKEDLVFVR